MPIDTLKVARRLREAGFTEPQAEAVRESDENSDAATKQDIALLATGLRAEMAALRAEMTAEFVAVRGEMRELEQRLLGRIEAVKSELIGKMFSMIVGAVLVNILAMFGAVFAFAKLLGH